MTNQEIIDYYKNLLILQYRGKTRARATIDALVKNVVAEQIYKQANDAFNVDTAVGNQLDVIGKYAGVSRSGYGFTSFITLNDTDYRTFIKLALILNRMGSSLYEIKNLLHEFFEGQIYVYDYSGMRLSYVVNQNIGSQDLVELFIIQNKLPVPMAVQRSTVILTPDVTGYFGFRRYYKASDNGGPFNRYAGTMDGKKWLRYSEGLVPLFSLLTEDSDVIVQENGDALYI